MKSLNMPLYVHMYMYECKFHNVVACVWLVCTAGASRHILVNAACHSYKFALNVLLNLWWADKALKTHIHSDTVSHGPLSAANYCPETQRMQSDRQMTARKTASRRRETQSERRFGFLSLPNLIEFLTLASAGRTPPETDAGTDARCHLSSALVFYRPGGKHQQELSSQALLQFVQEDFCIFPFVLFPLLVIHSYSLSLFAVGSRRYRESTIKGPTSGPLKWILSGQTVCSELTRTAGVSVEVLQEGQEGVRGDSVDGYHSTPGLSVLPAEHGRHYVTASHQHGPVGRQHAP